MCALCKSGVICFVSEPDVRQQQHPPGRFMAYTLRFVHAFNMFTHPNLCVCVWICSHCVQFVRKHNAHIKHYVHPSLPENFTVPRGVPKCKVFIRFAWAKAIALLKSGRGVGMVLALRMQWFTDADTCVVLNCRTNISFNFNLLAIQPACGTNVPNDWKRGYKNM